MHVKQVLLCIRSIHLPWRGCSTEPIYTIRRPQPGAPEWDVAILMIFPIRVFSAVNKMHPSSLKCLSEATKYSRVIVNVNINML